MEGVHQKGLANLNSGAVASNSEETKGMACQAMAAADAGVAMDEVPIIIRSFCSAVIPKLLPADIVLLEGLLRDVFPGSAVPDFSDEVLRQVETARARAFRVGVLFGQAVDGQGGVCVSASLSVCTCVGVGVMCMCVEFLITGLFVGCDRCVQRVEVPAKRGLARKAYAASSDCTSAPWRDACWRVRGRQVERLACAFRGKAT